MASEANEKKKKKTPKRNEKKKVEEETLRRDVVSARVQTTTPEPVDGYSFNPANGWPSAVFMDTHAQTLHTLSRTALVAAAAGVL